jgi:hypothetical protein
MPDAGPLRGGIVVRRSIIAFVLALVLGSLLAVPASAAIDQTPPKLHVPVRPAFVVGNRLDQYRLIEDRTYWYTTNIAQLIRYSATDDVGVCSYDVYAVLAGSEPSPILQFSQKTHVTYPQDDYVDDFGGGIDNVDGFSVTARDCAGNATTKVLTDQTLLVIQENWFAATAYHWRQPIAYTGEWTRARCACFLAHHAKSTTEAGARASFTRAYDAGDRVALVMSRGPDRGAASVRIDGSWVANVDTYRASNENRVVVFATTMTAGTHTVTIVNHGTAGRPRIDLDAVLINTSSP